MISVPNLLQPLNGNKNIYMALRFFLTIVLVLTTLISANAQQFTSHAVKEGETLYSIARQYKVDTGEILKYNKEIKENAVLQPNTILVVPLVSSSTNAVKPTTTESAEQEKDVQVKPASFTTHKVRKRETLFSISRRYDIKEEDLKRYNKELYASTLKKGMRLRIPIFPEEEVMVDSLEVTSLETYTVLPKETRWSIANKNGITIDSLVALNPSLSSNSSYLAAGQTLQIPIKQGSSLKDQAVELYVSYTVPAKMTLYSLSREYGMNSQDIVRLNPEIAENGGLKEGMVIRLPEKKVQENEINTDNYLFYEVKPKQTEYSLTRNLGLDYKELMELNPELSRGLQAGMILKIPIDQAPNLEVKNSLLLDKINLVDSINRINRPKLVYLLPFRTDKLDLSNLELASEAIDKSNAIKYSLGLYSGALIAIDSIAQLGISVDVMTYDTQLSLERTREILRSGNLEDVSAIVGPLQLNSLKEVAVKAANNQIPVLAPLTSANEFGLDNVFFTIPSDDILRERILTYVEEQRKDENIIVISDAKSKAVSDTIKKRFPVAQTLSMLEDEENISMDLEAFTALLSLDTENWVFVETDNFKVVSSVSSILNSTNSDTTVVKMFTTNKNKAFENNVISGTHLSNLNFTYPSVDKESSNNAFFRRYKRKFGTTPDRYAIRGFDITYDLLLKLAYKQNLYEVSNTIGSTEYCGNKFDYKNEGFSGYNNLATYIMTYHDMRIIRVEEKPKTTTVQ